MKPCQWFSELMECVQLFFHTFLLKIQQFSHPVFCLLCFVRVTCICWIKTQPCQIKCSRSYQHSLFSLMPPLFKDILHLVYPIIAMPFVRVCPLLFLMMRFLTGLRQCWARRQVADGACISRLHGNSKQRVAAASCSRPAHISRQYLISANKTPKGWALSVSTLM